MYTYAISILMYEPRTSHQVGTQQSKETARRSSSSFGLYHGQRRSPVETHRKSLLQEEGSRAGRSLTPSRPMTASIHRKSLDIIARGPEHQGNLHDGTRSVTVQLQYGTPNQENNVHLRFYITPVPFCGGATQRYRRNQKNNVHLP